MELSSIIAQLRDAETARCCVWTHFPGAPSLPGAPAESLPVGGLLDLAARRARLGRPPGGVVFDGGRVAWSRDGVRWHALGDVAAPRHWSDPAWVLDLLRADRIVAVELPSSAEAEDVPAWMAATTELEVVVDLAGAVVGRHATAPPWAGATVACAFTVRVRVDRDGWLRRMCHETPSGIRVVDLFDHGRAPLLEDPASHGAVSQTGAGQGVTGQGGNEVLPWM
jgi:hypothetical protein